MMSGWGESLVRVAIPLAVVALLVWLSFRRDWPKVVRDGPADEPYRVYTRDYDLELSADQVAARLPTASWDAAHRHLAGEQGAALAASGMEALLVQQRMAFDFDAALGNLRPALAELDPKDLLVALLIDQSGSMKGPPIASAAVTATLLADLVSALGGAPKFSAFPRRAGGAAMRVLNG